jgi:LPXTG-site transpeptidase (sortase) family protein
MTKFAFAFCVGLAFSLWLVARDARRAASRGRSPWRWNALALLSTLAALGLGGSLLVQPPSASGVATPPTDVPPPAGFGKSREARLVVPALNLDALIVDVPLRDGKWDVDWLGTEVGRLETTGAHPGDDLAMVFTGHVTLSALDRGPFADLWRLKPLDEIVYRGGGVDYGYVVSEVATIAPEEVGRLFVPDGASLLLVTCTDWDYLHEVYRQRLLVRAVLVRQVGAVFR